MGSGFLESGFPGGNDTWALREQPNTGWGRGPLHSEAHTWDPGNPGFGQADCSVVSPPWSSLPVHHLRAAPCSLQSPHIVLFSLSPSFICVEGRPGPGHTGYHAQAPQTAPPPHPWPLSGSLRQLTSSSQSSSPRSSAITSLSPEAPCFQPSPGTMTPWNSWSQTYSIRRRL